MVGEQWLFEVRVGSGSVGVCVGVWVFVVVRLRRECVGVWECGSVGMSVCVVVVHLGSGGSVGVWECGSEV